MFQTEDRQKTGFDNKDVITPRNTLNKIKATARYRWQEILRNLGKLNKAQLSNRAQPCPACGGRDRYRFDDKAGNGTYYCNQCNPGDGLSLLRKVTGWDFRQAIINLESYLNLAKSNEPNLLNLHNPPNVSTVANARRMQKILGGCLPPTHDEASPLRAYLNQRGLSSTILSSLQDLNYHPRLAYYEGKDCLGHYPAMVAIVRNIENKPVSLHRTYLTKSGGKAVVKSPKKLLSPLFPGATKGTAIRLTKPHEGILGITEGIETALAVMLTMKLPCWAAISAHSLSHLKLPKQIMSVYIMADADRNQVGEVAGRNLAKRLLKENRKVCIYIPSQSKKNASQDWLDFYNQRRLIS